MKSNSIDRIVVSPNNPHNNNTLWVDTSNGESNAVLKYKGKTIVGGNTNNNTIQQGKNYIDKDCGVLSMYIPLAKTYSKSEFETKSGITLLDFIDAANGLYRWVRKLPDPVNVVPELGLGGAGIGLVVEPTVGSSPRDLPIISSPNQSSYNPTISAIDFNGIWQISYYGGEEYTVSFIAFGSSSN